MLRPRERIGDPFAFQGHMPGMLIGIIPAIAVPLLIIAIQRR